MCKLQAAGSNPSTRQLPRDTRFALGMALVVGVIFGLKLMDYNFIDPNLTSLIYHPRPLNLGNWAFLSCVVVVVAYYLPLRFGKHCMTRSVVPGALTLLVTAVVSAVHLSPTYSRFHGGMLSFMVQICLAAGIAAWVRYTERSVANTQWSDPADKREWIKAQISIFGTVTGTAILGLFWLAVPWIGQLRMSAAALATCEQDRQVVMDVLHAQMWILILLTIFGPIGQCVRRIKHLLRALEA